MRNNCVLVIGDRDIISVGITAQDPLSAEAVQYWMQKYTDCRIRMRSHRQIGFRQTRNAPCPEHRNTKGLSAR